MTDSMKISPEYQARSTESRQNLLPIPLIPPLLNSPYPYASPPQPSNSQLPSKLLVERPILKHTAPSKRPLPDINSKNSSENTENVNAFIPKELAEIIATRQCREHSTLANLNEDIEKEEAEAFKAYLRLSLSNIAAADSSPTPPRVPVAIATPRIILSQVPSRGSDKNAELPKNPQSDDNSWATVARKGKKKARVNLNATARVAPLGKTSHRSTNKDKSEDTTSSTKAISDKRLFLRLPTDHEWRQLSPAGVREVIVKRLLISPSLIGRIKPVHSGFALSPSNSKAREEMLKAGNELFLSGAKLEPATNWVSVLVPTVPAFIHMEKGQVERLIELVWRIFVKHHVVSGFRVLYESGIIRPYKKQQPNEFCKRCNGHHPAKNSSRAPSCGNYGSTNHNTDIYMAATKFRNCGGPHRADSRRYLARPTHSGAPSKEQLKAYRQAGESISSPSEPS
ncbi:hypothetical protein EPUL_003799 [Erysiphe pulchra]|uniref:Uncharacterized protein n=1 Tax=Erysiphe pulchra TaxID=225359 RepID=A0A2S4PLU6_9PEZI|nr:hypothetical protein EPUL_003799 [Erysiphe pulchra]